MAGQSNQHEETGGKKRRVKFSTEVMFIVSVVFCVSLSIIYLSRYSTIRNLLLHEEELQQKIELLERENRKLKMDLETLSTPEGIERLARERLGLVKPEESVYRFLPPGSSTAAPEYNPGQR